jgi:geranylgeranyl pyrophosphate synthase
MDFKAFVAETAELSEEAIDKYLQRPEFAKLINLVNYPNKTGGKRIRPTLSRLWSLALGGPDHETVRIASGCELIHQASLVHDDIIDGDNYRRGKPTLHNLFNAGQAVMAGDLLVMLAFKIGFKRNTSLGMLLIDTFNRLIRGNALEIMPGRDKWDMKLYNEIINDKTAAMFEAPCVLGTIMADANKDIQDAAELYGNTIGIMYQLADDLSDVIKFTSQGDVVGDIANRTITMPMILLHNMSSGKDKRLLERYLAGLEFTSKDYATLRHLITGSGVIEETQEEIDGLVNTATELLDILEESKYKDTLLFIPEYMKNAILGDVEVILETDDVTRNA